MNADQIRAAVAAVMRATKADAEPPFAELCALAATVLVDLHRVADALERLASRP